MVGHQDQLGVAAAHHQAEIREPEGILFRQASVQMSRQMVHRDQRLVLGQRQRLGGLDPDDQRTDQAGTGRDGDRVDSAPVRTGFSERLLDDRNHRLELQPGGDLRHHAARGAVHVDLGADDVRLHASPVRDHGGRGFVARGLDGEDSHDHQYSLLRLTICALRNSPAGRASGTAS